jgi:hypothetical protein
MPENDPRQIIQSKGGFFRDLSLRVKLILRLIGDPRVSLLLKAIPIGSFVYLLFPDIAPGPIDDAAIIWLGTSLFVELCPPEVVAEHMEALRKTIPGAWSEPPAARGEEEVVEGQFRDE